MIHSMQNQGHQAGIEVMHTIKKLKHISLPSEARSLHTLQLITYQLASLPITFMPYHAFWIGSPLGLGTEVLFIVREKSMNKTLLMHFIFKH